MQRCKCKVRAIIFSTICASLFFASSVFSSNLRFLNYAAMTYFCQDDLSILLSTIDVALAKHPDNVKAIWRNPATGTWGYVVPSATSMQSGHLCRSVHIYNCAQRGSGEVDYRLCYVCGEWRFSREAL